MSQPPPTRPALTDAFARLTPPPGGIQRLRASLDAPPPRPWWLRAPALAVACALLLSVGAALSSARLITAPPQPDAGPTTLIVIQATALPPQTSPPLRLALARPSSTALLPVTLEDDAVAFYWAVPH
jgi:hypothetical protein